MVQTPAIVQGREAFVRRKWRDAFELMSVADRESSLEPDDLERFAAAAYLIGEVDQATVIWTRAHHDLMDEGSVERAARWGFWLSLQMLLAGDVAQATGWMARSQRLLKDREEKCAEQGYGHILTGLLTMGKGTVRSVCMTASMIGGRRAGYPPYARKRPIGCSYGITAMGPSADGQLSG